MFNNKREYIKNPQTNRLILVGGRLWKKLMSENVFNKNDKILYEIIDDDLDDDIKNEKLKTAKEIINNTNIDKKTQAVKGRGRYKNCIVKKKRKDTEIIVDKENIKLLKIQKLVKNILDIDNSDLDDDELDELIYNKIKNDI